MLRKASYKDFEALATMISIANDGEDVNSFKAIILGVLQSLSILDCGPVDPYTPEQLVLREDASEIIEDLLMAIDDPGEGTDDDPIERLVQESIEALDELAKSVLVVNPG